jgi:Tfp pilus assembly pilus retraction ATPase PilT
VETYGIDWEGPVSVDDEETVTIEELADLLSNEEKEELRDMLSPMCTSLFSQQEMLCQFVMAKSFVNQSVT